MLENTVPIDEYTLHCDGLDDLEIVPKPTHQLMQGRQQILLRESSRKKNGC